MRGKRKLLDFFPITTTKSVYIDGTSKPIHGILFDSQGNSKIKEINKTSMKVIIINEVDGFDPDDISITINKLVSESDENITFYLEEGKKYKIKSPIIFNKRQNLILNGTIEVIGNMEYSILIEDEENISNNFIKKIFINKLVSSNIDKGIVITNCYHMDLDIGYILGFGSCISIEPNKTNNTFAQGVQYCNIKFQQLRNNSSEGACILFNPGNNQLPWINENTFIGGRIRGTNGIKSIRGTTQLDPFNNNKFYNIGFEGLSGNGIELNFGNNNIFMNTRFENIQGIYINDNIDSSYNKYSSPQLIDTSKININGKNIELNMNLVNGGGSLTSFYKVFNCYGTKNNSNSFGFNIVDRNETGVSFCENNKNIFERYALICTNNIGEKFFLPCKETKVKEINNEDFKMDYLYKDLRIISNNKIVNITIPNIFFYDSAEFNFSTNWNTNDIIFINEDGEEQFKIRQEDGNGTWNVLFIPQRGKFSPLKITDKCRSF